MKMSYDDVSSGFPFHSIKKVVMVEDRYREPPDAESRVNQLLSKGWILLNIHAKEVGPKDYRVVFVLGHTDASADNTVKAIYTSPSH